MSHACIAFAGRLVQARGSARGRQFESTEDAVVRHPVMTSDLTSKSNRNLVGLLAGSALYREYEQAFCQMTGMPLALRPSRRTRPTGSLAINPKSG